MKRLFALLFALFAAAAHAQVPQPPEIAARSYVLFDVTTGQVLTQKEADTPFEPASLTKLMSGYLVFQALKDKKLTLQQMLPVSERAWRTGMTGASRSFLPLNSQVSVDDLLKGMIVQSGNDATVVLAEGVGGSYEQFVAMMNRQAQAFGLKATAFKNPEGLSAPGHTSTARELAVIATRLIQDFPEYLHYYSMREFTFNKIKQPNRNRLLWRDASVDGIKTGHAEKTGYHLLGSAVREGRRLVSVVLGTTGEEERAQQTLALLNYGFRFYETATLAEAGTPLLTVRAWKGTEKELGLGLAAPLQVSLPRGARERVQLQPEASGPVHAPVAAGQALGTLKIMLDGKVLRTAPLVALAALPEGNLWRRASDGVQLWIQDKP